MAAAMFGVNPATLAPVETSTAINCCAAEPNAEVKSPPTYNVPAPLPVMDGPTSSARTLPRIPNAVFFTWGLATALPATLNAGSTLPKLPGVRSKATR